MGAQRYSRRSLARELLLVAVAIVYCIPFYLLVAISLQTTAQSYKTPMSFPIPPHFGNFSTAWGRSGQGGLAHPLESSLIITVLSGHRRDRARIGRGLHDRAAPRQAQ